MLKIAIDLSTTTSGVWVHHIESNRHAHYLVNTKDEHSINAIYKIWNDLFTKKLLEHSVDVMVGIEVSNFSNPKLTQKFSMIAGMIMAIVCKNYIYPQFKIFNSNEWQYKIGCSPQDERATRKRKAKEFAERLFPQYNFKVLGQDIIDACCICHYLDELTTTDAQAEYQKVKKVAKDKQQKQIIKLQSKIIALESTLRGLDALKNKKRINTLTNQLNKIKEDLNNVKQKSAR